MSPLAQYVMNHTEVTREGRPGAVDLVLVNVSTRGEPTVAELRRLIMEHEPDDGEELQLFDGIEHSYIHIGAWIGDQLHALLLMGLGARLGLWQLWTPRTVLGLDASDELARAMAAKGLVTVQWMGHLLEDTKP